MGLKYTKNKMNLQSFSVKCEKCLRATPEFLLDCFCQVCAKCATHLSVSFLKKLRTKKNSLKRRERIQTSSNKDLENSLQSSNTMTRHNEDSLHFSLSKGGQPDRDQVPKKRILRCVSMNEVSLRKCLDSKKELRSNLFEILKTNKKKFLEASEIISEISRSKEERGCKGNTCAKCGRETQNKMKSLKGMTREERSSFICNAFIVQNYLLTKELLSSEKLEEIKNFQAKILEQEQDAIELKDKAEFLEKVLENIAAKGMVKMSHIDPQILIQDKFGVFDRFFGLNCSTLQESQVQQDTGDKLQKSTSGKFDNEESTNRDHEPFEQALFSKQIQSSDFSEKILSHISEMREESNLMVSCQSRGKTCNNSRALKSSNPFLMNHLPSSAKKEKNWKSEQRGFKTPWRFLGKQNKIPSSGRIRSDYFSSQKKKGREDEQSNGQSSLLIKEMASQLRLTPSSRKKKWIVSEKSPGDNSYEEFESDFKLLSSKKKRFVSKYNTIRNNLISSETSNSRYRQLLKEKNLNVGREQLTKNYSSFTPKIGNEVFEFNKTFKPIKVSRWNKPSYKVDLERDYFKRENGSYSRDNDNKENIKPNDFFIISNLRKGDSSRNYSGQMVEARSNLLSSCNNQFLSPISQNVTFLTQNNNTKSTIGIKNPSKENNKVLVNLNRSKSLRPIRGIKDRVVTRKLSSNSSNKDFSAKNYSEHGRKNISLTVQSYHEKSSIPKKFVNPFDEHSNSEYLEAHISTQENVEITFDLEEQTDGNSPEQNRFYSSSSQELKVSKERPKDIKLSDLMIELNSESKMKEPSRFQSDAFNYRNDRRKTNQRQSLKLYDRNFPKLWSPLKDQFD